VLNVKRVRLVAAITAGIVISGCLVPSAPAQQANAGGGGIAVVDMTFLIKENPHLKAMADQWKANMARAEASFAKDREEIRQLTEQLKEQKPGTLEFKGLDEQITKKSTNLNVQYQMQRKEFAQEEAKIFHRVYQEIWQEVDSVAAQYNIALVLKASNEPIDPEKPGDIDREMTKQVIWHSKALDITGLIHERLKSHYGENTGARPNENPARMGVPFQR
jgi:Skp family chaperone for outer membrane proteins